MEIRWNELKSKRLKMTRGVSFEEILGEKLIAIRPHVKKQHQDQLLFLRKDCIWTVPFVWDEKGIFLKTLFPSRYHTKLYRRGELP